jgi:predicted O-methyltransferase YrrM
MMAQKEESGGSMIPPSDQEHNHLRPDSEALREQHSRARVVPTVVPPADYVQTFPVDGVKRIYGQPAQLVQAERLMLYTLMVAYQPERALEIGFYRGGSAAIIAAAMDDVGHGHLVSVDPLPQADEDWYAAHAHRVQLIQGRSPEDLDEAQAAAGGPFDFVFIDGNHSEEAVTKDLVGILPHLADSCYVLLHDAYHARLQRGVDSFVASHSDTIVDCGVLVRGRGHDRAKPDPTVWFAGMRLLLFLGNER